MSQTTQLTQTRVAEALVDLTREDAPAPRWAIDDLGTNIDGHLFGKTDVDRRQALAAWQRIIGAGPVEVRPSGGKEHLHVHGSYQGVPVEVMTIVAGPSSVCCSHCQAGGVR